MNDYISDYRLSKAKELIDNGHDYVLDIANQVGFSNANYFSKCFKKRFGMSPRGYIEQTQTNDR
jgi:two-component system response regulator YesN